MTRIIALAVALALVAPATGMAVDPVNTGFLSNVAIKGYDPVAYFADGRPVKGSKEHVFTWRGAQWRFASAEHRDLFASDPERWAPQYGGYCAWAVSQGYTANVDPDAWRIVDGKLYLNFSREVQERWERDIPGHVAAADANWPKLLEEE